MGIENKTLKKLYIGIIGYGIIAALVSLVVFLTSIITLKNLLLFLLGLVLGLIITFFWARDIYKTIDIGLELGEEGAQKYMRKHSIIRMVIIIVILIGGAWLSLNIIIGTMVGLMGLKLSAYFQIYLEKRESKKNNEC